MRTEAQLRPVAGFQVATTGRFWVAAGDETGKIDKSDFDLLTKALPTETSRHERILKLLLNPFAKVAGLESLALGFAVISLLSFFGLVDAIHFPGIIDFHYANPEIQRRLTLQGLFLQNIVICLVLSILFYFGARTVRGRQVRFIDFLGTVTLSRYPYLIWTAIVLPAMILHPAFKSPGHHSSIFTTLNVLMAFIFLPWQGLSYFSALRESSGLREKSLWAVFLLSLGIGESFIVLFGNTITHFQ